MQNSERNLWLSTSRAETETAVFHLETSLSLHPSHSTQLCPHGSTPGTCAEVSIPPWLGSFFVCLNPTETHSLPTVPATCLHHSSSLCLHLWVLTPSATPGLCSVTNQNEKTSPSVLLLQIPISSICAFSGANQDIHCLLQWTSYIHLFLKRSSNKAYIPWSPIFWGLLKINMVPDVKSKTS